jgi:uncharacterized membrane protein
MSVAGLEDRGSYVDQRSVPWTVERVMPVLLAVLAALTALFLAWPLYRLFLPVEVHTNEAWNAFQIDRLLQGKALYPPANSLIANNYPPLYFYIIALLQPLIGDTIYTGRLVSLLSLAGLGAGVYACARQLGSSRMIAAVAAVWCLATFTRFYWYFMAMNDPHLLGLAVMTAGLAWFLARLHRGAAVEPALAVMLLAGLIKHSLWATPLTALLWLAIVDRRQLARAVLFCAASGAAALAVFYAAYGSDFFANLLAPRLMTLKRASVMLGRLQWLAPAMVINSLWVAAQWKDARAKFSVLFGAVAFAVYFFQSLGQGITVNAQMELAVAVALGLSLTLGGIADVPAFTRRGLVTGAVWIAAILVLRLAASERLEPVLTVFSAEYRQSMVQQAALMEEEVARVQAMTGNIACSVPTVCVRAGKDFVYDDFLIGQRVRSGRWTEAQRQAAIAANAVTFVEVNPSSEWDRSIPAVFQIAGIR